MPETTSASATRARPRAASRQPPDAEQRRRQDGDLGDGRTRSGAPPPPPNEPSGVDASARYVHNDVPFVQPDAAARRPIAAMASPRETTPWSTTRCRAPPAGSPRRSRTPAPPTAPAYSVESSTVGRLCVEVAASTVPSGGRGVRGARSRCEQGEQGRQPEGARGDAQDAPEYPQPNAMRFRLHGSIVSPRTRAVQEASSGNCRCRCDAPTLDVRGRAPGLH